MIGDANKVLSEVGDPNYPRVQGWTIPPPPGDTSYPVPPAWFDPSFADQLATLERLKSDMFYRKRFQFWQRAFTDATFLRGVTLGALGVVIEMTIHNAMHMRWATPPGSVRPEPQQATGDIDPTQVETIGTEWDDPRYDFLGDTYSSHVNPIFWRLHGWIDDRVEQWKVANGVYGNDFWTGTWVGKEPEHGGGASVHALLEDPEHAAPHMKEVEEVVSTIARSGVFHRPFMQSVSIEAW